MERRPIAADTPFQAWVVEQALAMAQAVERASDAAADGTVLVVAEALVVERGRELLRTTLQAALQAQAEGVEKRGGRAAAVGTTKAARCTG